MVYWSLFLSVWEIKNKDFGLHQIFSSFSIYFIFVGGPPYFSSYSSSARFESVVPWVGVHRLLLHISWGVHLFYTVLAPTPFYRQILAPHLNDTKKGKKCHSEGQYNQSYSPSLTHTFNNGNIIWENNWPIKIVWHNLQLASNKTCS